MSESADPFELLRTCNPVRADDVAGAASTPEAEQTLNEIIASADDQPTRRGIPARGSLRVRRRALLVAVVSIAGVIAAVAVALTQGESKQLTVGCYASANLGARTVVVPTRNGSAVEACRDVWRQGGFSQTLTSELQACVLPSGGIGVFPTRTKTACQDLRLAPLTHANIAPAMTSATLLRFKNALVRTFLGRRCMTARQAIRVVTTAIRRFRLAGWNGAVTGRFTRQRPCAGLAFDEATHRVLLVPMPRR